MQQIGDARNRIVNDHERLWLSGSCQWTEARKGYFSANAALAIAVKITLCFPRDVIAIGQRLSGFRYGYRLERRASDDFAAVHSAKAKQLHSFSERRRDKITFWSGLHYHYLVRRWRLLRTGNSRTEHKRAPNGHAHG